MEKKYQSLNIFEFQERFPDDEAYYQYLAKIKWASGFTCRKCGHAKYHQGQGKHTLKCSRCDYQESPNIEHTFS